MSATRTNGARARVAQLAEHREPGLMDALLALAAEAPKLTRDATGQIQSRTYRYVTLDALLDAIVPLLIKHDLVWSAKPTFADGQVALKYKLTHVPSGEFEEDVMPLMGATDSQGVGSALTYARRYALLAVLNLAPGEDDDGAAASTSTNASNSVQQNGQNSRPTAAPPKSSERQITADQREKLIKPRAKKAELTDGELANVMLVAAGDEPREWRSEEHAAQTMARLLDRLPMRLKDAVLEGIDAAAEAKR